MLNLNSKIESKPGVVFLSQIVVFKEETEKSNNKVNTEVIQSLTEWGFNFALPLICLTDEEDKYRLLTGIAIYESAIASGIDKIWAILIAAKKQELEKAIAQARLQSNLNEKIIQPEDIEEFIEFLNNLKSPLTSIRGIGDQYAKLIVDKRPYTSKQDMQKKLGAKRSLNWVRAYKEAKI